MDKFKSLIINYRYQIFIVIEVSILIIGAYIAFLTVYRFEIFVRAALGFTIHYLLFLEYVVTKRLKNENFGTKFEFPKDIRYFVMDFVVVIILVWAGIQILDLIRYLI